MSQGWCIIPVMDSTLFDEKKTSIIQNVLPALRRFLSSREHSAGELVDFLRRRRLCSAEEAVIVLKFLRDEGSIDDERFARNRCEYRFSKFYGPNYIRRELSGLKISSEITNQALAAVTEEEHEERAFQLAGKRLPSLISSEDAREKLSKFLQNRGYSFPQIRAAINRLKEEFPHWARRSVGLQDKGGDEYVQEE